MTALEQEKQIPIRAAHEEQRPQYQQSYAQVMRQMDRMDKTVSWQGDLMWGLKLYLCMCTILSTAEATCDVYLLINL